MINQISIGKRALDRQAYIHRNYQTIQWQQTVFIGFLSECYVQLLDQLSKSFEMEKPSHLTISEEQRQSNPLYRVVFNKIRNLNKKLVQIHQIESLDRKTLKPAQITKLSKKEETVKEIAQLEDFAGRYKAIMVENNLVYDKVDDLIKIAAMLTVGNRVHTRGYNPDETKTLYSEIYSQIFSKSIYNGQNQLSDEIVRVYHILQKYLSSPNYYRQCQDYMTYIKEIDERKNPQLEGASFIAKEKEAIIQHVSKINQILHSKTSHQLNKPKSLMLMSQVVEVAAQKVGNFLKQITQKQEEVRRKFSAFDSAEKQLKTQENESTNFDSEESKRELEQIEQVEAIVDDFLAESGNPFSKKKSDNTVIQNTALRQSKKRRRNKKRHNYVDVENIRKCSDTSLEPTPEKCKVKPRYVVKIQ